MAAKKSRAKRPPKRRSPAAASLGRGLLKPKVVPDRRRKAEERRLARLARDSEA